MSVAARKKEKYLCCNLVKRQHKTTKVTYLLQTREILLARQNRMIELQVNDKTAHTNDNFFTRNDYSFATKIKKLTTRKYNPKRENIIAPSY